MPRFAHLFFVFGDPVMLQQHVDVQRRLPLGPHEHLEKVRPQPHARSIFDLVGDTGDIPNDIPIGGKGYPTTSRHQTPH